MKLRTASATLALIAGLVSTAPASPASSPRSAAAASVRPAASAPAVTTIIPNGAWTIYHRDDAHTGYDPTAGPAVSASTGWVSPALDETVYGQPLVYNGLVYISTSNNTVYALNQAGGSIVWSRHFGAPETSGWQCGNVNPTGILGTGVIDVAQSRIYVVAFLHQFHSYYLYGLDLAGGTISLTTQILPGGFDWTIEQERGALSLSQDGSHVYIPFGGRAGDCGPYHGYLEGAPTAGGLADEHYRTPSTGEGIWAAGGIDVEDSTGNVFFATGNAIPCSGAINSDSVIRTSARLGSVSFFQPADWASHWCGPDLDLGSTTPVLISSTLMFTSGKYGQGFLINPANLGGTDGQLFPARNPYTGADVCHGINSDAVFGSLAYAAPFVYLECDGGGLVALRINTSTQSFSPSWNAGGSTTFGPPIVAGGVVWAVDINGSGLYGFNASSGAQVYHSAGFSVDHFTSPSEAGGQVFVSADNVIRSFNIVQGCVSVTAAANPPSPALVGTQVALAATASGCPNPSPQYEFWLRAPGATCCQLAQAYSTSNTYIWTTNAVVAGTYTFAVWAKDASSSGAFANGLGRYDAAFVMSYTLTAPVCTAITGSAAPPSSQPEGTAETIGGVATGCPNPLYEFFILYPGSQTWKRVQAYSAGSSFGWATSGAPAGVYGFSIWARDAESAGEVGNSLGTWDVYTTLQFNLTTTACTGLTASASPASTATAGTPVSVTGAGTGCPNPQYELWILYPGSQTWTLVGAYSSVATFSWSTIGLPTGTYHFSIWVRDAASPGTASDSLGSWDKYANLTYTLT